MFSLKLMILNKARNCYIPKMFFLTFRFLNCIYLIQMIFKEEKRKMLKVSNGHKM